MKNKLCSYVKKSENGHFVGEEKQYDTHYANAKGGNRLQREQHSYACGKPFSSPEFRKYGKNMTYSCAQSGKIACESINFYIAARNRLKDKKRRQSGNSAFQRVENKRNHAHFQTENAIHVGCSRIFASDGSDIGFFELIGKQNGSVYAAD